MQELLTPPDQRAKTFHRGSRAFDEKEVGYTDDGTYLFDTRDAAIRIPVTITEQNYSPIKSAI